MKKLKRTEATKYIVFLAINVPILVFFLLSKIIFGTVTQSLNYNVQAGLTDYLLKVSYATYNTDTAQFDFIIFYKSKGSVVTPTAETPSIYSICTNTNTDLAISYDTSVIRSNAYKVTAYDVTTDFDYLRVYLQSKTADKVVDDSYDQFGDLIEGYTIEGSTEYLEIRIDKEDIRFISSEEAATLTLPIIDIDEELSDEITTTATTTKTEPTTTTTTTTTSAEQSVTTTTTTTKTEPSVTTTTKKPTVTTTTTKKPTVTTTTTKKTTTTTTTTTKAKTTTTAKKTTTTTTTTTLVTAEVIPTGLKISCPLAVNGIITLNTGGTAQLTADFTPDNVTDKSVMWSSRKPEVVTVDKNGKLTAVEKGTTTVSCETANGRFKVAIMVKVI